MLILDILRPKKIITLQTMHDFYWCNHLDILKITLNGIVISNKDYQIKSIIDFAQTVSVDWLTKLSRVENKNVFMLSFSSLRDDKIENEMVKQVIFDERIRFILESNQRSTFANKKNDHCINRFSWLFPKLFIELILFYWDSRWLVNQTRNLWPDMYWNRSEY